MKLSFEKLEYQEKAVTNIIDIFKDINFKSSKDSSANIYFDLEKNREIIQRNILEIQNKNRIQEKIDDLETLSLDILMETGTGKTFTFIETIYKLNQKYKLSKFIILVPSNAIRQGAIKNLEITADFFYREYKQTISILNYTPKTVKSFINSSNRKISVLISTYQSFNKAKNFINSKLEQNLFSESQTYMEAIAKLKPVIIIDEPHRFDGKQTKEYLEKFNPLFRLRFGATFKKDEYQNLIYTLDSVEAFNKNLVKSITVDTVGNSDIQNRFMFKSVKGSSGKYTATLQIQNRNFEVMKNDNLGKIANISILQNYIIEKITKREIIFTNSFTLQLEEESSFGILLSEIQEQIIDRTIETHFEREEKLFKLGIKSLSLIFIDSVDSYLKNGKLVEIFERKYKKYLELYLQKDLDSEYRKYLESGEISDVHKGYFSKSNKEKDEVETINLILKEKEKLLSFDTNLRFIFSMWALQEGWDNPNIFTLSKLAPSSSKITKLQQIGRGLRLAVNQDGKRITQDNRYFEFVNDLNVIVPSTEKDFVESIQNEIVEKSFNRGFSGSILEKNGIAPNPQESMRLLFKLEDFGIIKVDENNNFTILKTEISDDLELSKNIDIKKLQQFLSQNSFKKSVRQKSDTKKEKTALTINQKNYREFRKLWENINSKAVIRYRLDLETLLKNIIENINQNFRVEKQILQITTHKNIEKMENNISVISKDIFYESIFSINEFVERLAEKLNAPFQTISDILNSIFQGKFQEIFRNENIALLDLESIIKSNIYKTLLNEISYDIREVEFSNLETVQISELGKDRFDITNPNIQEKSLYLENFMMFDSEIEKDTISESSISDITVFAKLPKVNIPVLNGEYNPDFGYVIKQENRETLYLVIETKGYETYEKIPEAEKYKIESAKKFFQALKDRGLNIEYKTKINSDKLIEIIKGVNI